MEIINKTYQADEASLRIDAYLDLLGEEKSISFLNAVPSEEESKDPAVAVRATVVCVAFDFQPIDDTDEHHQWKQMVATQTLVKEMLMVMMDSSHCKDTLVVGNYIYGIFSTPFKTQIDEILETIAKLNSARDLVAMKLKSKGIETPKLRIGADYGSLLRTTLKIEEKSNNYMWNGTRFRHLTELVERQMKEEEDIVVTERFRQNVKDDYKKYLLDRDGKYVANVRNVALKKWIEEHE